MGKLGLNFEFLKNFKWNMVYCLYKKKNNPEIVYLT